MYNRRRSELHATPKNLLLLSKTRLNLVISRPEVTPSADPLINKESTVTCFKSVTQMAQDINVQMNLGQSLKLKIDVQYARTPFLSIDHNRTTPHHNVSCKNPSTRVRLLSHRHSWPSPLLRNPIPQHWLCWRLTWLASTFAYSPMDGPSPLAMSWAPSMWWAFVAFGETRRAQLTIWGRRAWIWGRDRELKGRVLILARC